MQLSSLSILDHVKRKAVKQKLEIIEKNICKYNQILIDKTTFKRKQMLEFLSQVLSNTEDNPLWLINLKRMIQFFLLI